MTKCWTRKKPSLTELLLGKMIIDLTVNLTCLLQQQQRTFKDVTASMSVKFSERDPH